MRKKIRGAKKSLTIWLNTAFSSVIIGLPIAETQLPAIKPYLPTNAYWWISAAIILANVALRFRTNKGLEDK